MDKKDDMSVLLQYNNFQQSQFYLNFRNKLFGHNSLCAISV